ncbi:MAG: DUF952 domain-containing protein [Crocosphaera sp.]
MIFHITTPETWQKAKQNKVYKCDSLETEGFIHCATKSQVLTIANTFYSNYEQLIILIINPDKLLAKLQWESPIHPNPNLAENIDDSQKFPHIYGVINLDAIEEIIQLCKNKQGFFDSL